MTGQNNFTQVKTLFVFLKPAAFPLEMISVVIYLFMLRNFKIFYISKCIFEHKINLLSMTNAKFILLKWKLL